MKNKKDDSYLLSCVIALVLTLLLSLKLIMGGYLDFLDILGEAGKIVCNVVLSGIFFIVVQRYSLKIVRGYKKYFGEDENC